MNNLILQDLRDTAELDTLALQKTSGGWYSYFSFYPFYWGVPYYPQPNNFWDPSPIYDDPTDPGGTKKLIELIRS